jgi:hypothetical protein
VASSSTEISFLTADANSWPNMYIMYMIFQAKCVCVWQPSPVAGNSVAPMHTLHHLLSCNYRKKHK